MNRRILVTLAVGVAASLLLSANDQAMARRRGPSKAQVAAQKEKRDETAAMKAAVAKAQKGKDAELMKKYDLNKNGKIDGGEKPAWDKYWREVETGKTAHPYSTIKIDKDDLKTDKKK
ncbi:MAG TPA: hypothetical protein VHZ24_12660 [Pirellulales bacterium]|jgi:hypothetical protein|nr:hypothetical protein [Pirellulales bacterium]